MGAGSTPTPAPVVVRTAATVVVPTGEARSGRGEIAAERLRARQTFRVG